MARKRYWGKEVDVFFDLSICEHVGFCLQGLPKVFDLNRKPWILPDNAPANDVVMQVMECPSGALTYELKN